MLNRYGSASAVGSSVTSKGNSTAQIIVRIRVDRESAMMLKHRTESAQIQSFSASADEVRHDRALRLLFRGWGDTQANGPDVGRYFHAASLDNEPFRQVLEEESRF
jgi:hypothetical protein